MGSDYYVYKHTCPNGKMYIGITCQKPEKRWGNGSRYKYNSHFYSAIIKYGWDNIKHEILFANLTKEQACQKEIALIALYQSNNSDYGYNLSYGGESGINGYKWTEEQKRHVNIDVAKRNLKKAVESHIGKPLSAETRLKISEKAKLRTGEKNNRYGKPSAKRKKVLCTETNTVYESITAASSLTGISISNIARAANKERKTAGGFHWEYKE